MPRPALTKIWRRSCLWLYQTPDAGDYVLPDARIPTNREPISLGPDNLTKPGFDLFMITKHRYSDYDAFLAQYSVTPPPDFNYSFDVIDRIAAEEPGRRAMIHVTPDGDTREYTFAWFAEASARLASSLKEQGLKKGDRVMLIL